MDFITYVATGGLLLIGDIDMAVYDENREHLKFPVYHTAWTMEENLEKQKGLSWNSAWADGLASISYSPTYAPPSALVKKFPKLTLLVDQDLWSAYGEWPENKDRKRKEIKELWKANFEVRNRPIVIFFFEPIFTGYIQCSISMKRLGEFMPRHFLKFRRGLGRRCLSVD
jgi:hypothetical protein